MTGRPSVYTIGRPGLAPSRFLVVTLRDAEAREAAAAVLHWLGVGQLGQADEWGRLEAWNVEPAGIAGGLARWWVTVERAPV